jgi:YHS domain-containing protein
MKLTGWRRIGVAGMAAALAALAAQGTQAQSDRGANPLKRHPIIVTDRLTGLAIWGYDPVAYHLGVGPVQGSPLYEIEAFGVTWRFANDGNAEAFRQTPEAYQPCLGGFDPMAVARGAPVAGNPLVHATYRGRLCLFANDANREAFEADPAAALDTADHRWLSLEGGLPR